ncbi:MAG: RDD family protein [Culicoidibacterales bacterium]
MGRTKLRKTATGMTNEVLAETAATTTETQFAQAVWWKPLLAYLLDFSIYAVAAFIFLTSTQVYAAEGSTVYSGFMMLCLAITSVYLYAVMPKLVTGQTIGRWIMRIRLDAPKKPMTYWRYFLREFMAKITMVGLLIPMTLVYGGFQWVSKGERPQKIMLDELFQTVTVDLTKPQANQ